MDTYGACLFLPDYLLEESFSDTGQYTQEATEEYRPAIVYTE